MIERVVVFDLDGTLIESDQDLGLALNQTLAELGRPPYTRAEVRTMIGHGVLPLLTRALGDEAAAAQARPRFLAHYQAGLVHATRPYPGIMPLLRRLRGWGVAAAVATNKPAAFTRTILERLGLLEAGLWAWAAGDEVPRGKPDPAVIGLAVERLGLGPLRPDQVAYVGDMPVDVVAGRAYGARVIGAGWGFDPEGLQRAKPDLYFETVTALEEAWAEEKKAGQAPATSRKGGLPDDP